MVKLLAWGANQYGQLALEGWPVMEQCETPRVCSLDGLPSGILDNVKQICGGGGHTMLLDNDGSVWACGQNNRGQCAVPVDTEFKMVRPWTKVEMGARKIIKVAAGWEHSTALDEEGKLFGWGSNSHGQIGQVVERGKWIHIPQQLADSATDVSAGLRHTVWITSIGQIISNGSTGENKIGVPPVLKPLKVASGQKHNFVLMGNKEVDEESGKIFCWGDNKFRQLATDPEKVPKSADLIHAEGLKHYDLVDVKSGWSHGAAISNEGQVICWGRSNYGQLGRPEVHQHLWSELKNREGNSSRATQIAVGSEHTLVLTESGDVWSCGWNEHGNCGNGTLVDQFLPQVVIRNALLIGCGASHCFAITE